MSRPRHESPAAINSTGNEVPSGPTGGFEVSVLIWPPTDETLDRIAARFEPYAQQHPDAKIDIRRCNPATIWIRLIDPDFARIDRSARHDILWDLIEPLEEDDRGQISLLLALSPKESKASAGSRYFDHQPVENL